MRSKLLLFLFLLFPAYLFSQELNDKIIFMDSTFETTIKGNHTYYRIIKDYHLVKENYTIEEYYKSGTLKRKGISKGNDIYRYFGFLTSYYENGTIYEKIFYKDSEPEGPYISWHENGEKRAIGEYLAADSEEKKIRILKINHYWDENGIQKVIEGNGFYDEIEAKLSSSGAIKNGTKEGIWKGVDKNLKITFTENYIEGKLISGVSIDENLIERTYKEIKTNATSKKGMTDFYSFVAKNFKVPEDETINGKIVVSFTIDKNGIAKNIEVLRGITNETDREAIRIIRLNKNWKIAQSRGVAIDENYIFPIVIMNAG